MGGQKMELMAAQEEDRAACWSRWDVLKGGNLRKNKTGDDEP